MIQLFNVKWYEIWLGPLILPGLWEALKTKPSRRTSSTSQHLHTEEERVAKLYRNDPEILSSDQSVQPACDGRPADHPHLEYLTITHFIYRSMSLLNQQTQLNPKGFDYFRRRVSVSGLSQVDEVVLH